MLKWIIVIALIIVCVLFPFVRCVILHPYSVCKNGGIDLFKYFKFKQYYVCPEGDVLGKIRMYCAEGDKVFGCGKTLSMVHYMCRLYDRYNNRIVYDLKRDKWVTQRVVILTNVNIKHCGYIYLDSLTQITDYAKKFYQSDLSNDTSTVLLVGIDEIGVMLNSRKFKDNIDPMFLNTLLTCRKYKIALYCTSQRFSMVDALFRQVTQEVVSCHKVWRLQGLKQYDAYEMENCTNPTLIAPKFRDCWFVHNKDYNCYDTHAMVKSLELHQKLGDLMSEEEILNMLTVQPVDSVSKYSRIAKKRRPSKKS